MLNNKRIHTKKHIIERFPSEPAFLSLSPTIANQHHLFLSQFLFGHFTKIAPICPPTSAEQEAAYLSRIKIMEGNSSQSQRQRAGEGWI